MDIGEWLGVGLASFLLVSSFRTVVVGGGLAELGDLLLVPARTACARELESFPHLDTPAITRAAHLTDATVIGAALLVFAEVGSRSG